MSLPTCPDGPPADGVDRRTPCDAHTDGGYLADCRDCRLAEDLAGLRRRRRAAAELPTPAWPTTPLITCSARGVRRLTTSREAGE